MCGIFCSLSNSAHIFPNDNIVERLQARGPDSTGHVFTVYSEASDGENKAYLTFYSTVLSLRGSNITTQPLQDDDKQFAICWNGEAWSIDGHSPHGNDTAAVHQLLSETLRSEADDVPADTCAESAAKVAKALSRVAGPYAFVFFDHSRGRLYFGRDFLGRRSLLMRTTSAGNFILSSVCDGDAVDGWVEVECDGVHYIDLDPACGGNEASPSCHQKSGSFCGGVVPYCFAEEASLEHVQHTSVLPILSLNRNVPSSHVPLHVNSSAVIRLENLLRQALSPRVCNIPAPPAEDHSIAAVSDRVRLAVLFSGGLDCTVLARLSHDLVPLSEPIDLLNVAFENPRIHKAGDINGNATSAYELCPDRITGRASYEELQRVCPGREWRFVAVDVPYSETQRHRDTVISLMHPHNTEMDLSIANALYFAARGVGSMSNKSDEQQIPDTTRARVLLSGLGADELFAGYTRHATAFRRGGFDDLLDELELDVSRLGKRNLGRDDRVMSHWGKEVRFPYLDEGLLSWALSAPVTDKCGFGEANSTEAELINDVGGSMLEPEKKVLRCLAWSLGMEGVAKEKKRAIQFGARTAKMSSGKTKGTHVLS